MGKYNKGLRSRYRPLRENYALPSAEEEQELQAELGEMSDRGQSAPAADPGEMQALSPDGVPGGQSDMSAASAGYEPEPHPAEPSAAALQTRSAEAGPEQMSDAGAAQAEVLGTESQSQVQAVTDGGLPADDDSDLGEDPDRVPLRPSLPDDKVPYTPGAILRHAREMLGMSMSEMASKLMLRVNTVSDIEHDRLNQPTAAAFVAAHIRNYAKLVNIDPDEIVSLYRSRVAEYERRQDRREERQKSMRGVLTAAGIGAVILGGVAFWLFRPAADDGLTTGTLVVEQTVKPEDDGQGGISMDVSSSALTTRVAEEPAANPFAAVEEKPAAEPDLNTRRARQQARELNTAELLSAGGETGSLVPQSPAAVKPELQAPASDQLTVAGAGSQTPAANRARDRQTAQRDEQRPQQHSEQSPVQRRGNQSASGPAPAAPAATVTAAQTQTPAQPQTQAGTQPAATASRTGSTGTDRSAAQEPAEAEQNAPALSTSLRDVSRNVSVSGRQGLASMNNVRVAVLGEVSVRITDSRGKVLSSGRFAKGQQISVTGIPPIKIAVTDSARIRVSYMGGTVRVPAGQQVTYTLPTR